MKILFRELEMKYKILLLITEVDYQKSLNYL